MVEIYILLKNLQDFVIKTLSEESKLSRQIDETFGNFDDNDTAYHIDADLFGEYLRDNICVQNGVNHIIVMLMMLL